jgi:hypothetical protein
LVEIGSVVSEEKIYSARKCPNLNCISIMMSFLTYITGFFMNFELLPILTNYEIKKRGDEIKKKSSPLKFG